MTANKYRDKYIIQQNISICKPRQIAMVFALYPDGSPAIWASEIANEKWVITNDKNERFVMSKLDGVWEYPNDKFKNAYNSIDEAVEAFNNFYNGKG